MKSFLWLSFILSFQLSALAQVPSDNTSDPSSEVSSEEVVSVPAKPKSRERPKRNQPPNESSSFIGDPDNLDPLNATRDNIKEDDEPVLEDIKDVLDSDLGSKASSQDPTKVSIDDPNYLPPPPEVADQNLNGGANSANSSSNNLMGVGDSNTGSSLVADDPDLELEKKFHQIYQRYNKNPTSNEAWAVASSRQTARLYEVQKGDTLWSISQVLFGDPTFWPKLWAINKQGILNPHFINPKMKIYFYEGDDQNAPTLTLGQMAQSDDNEPLQKNEEESESVTRADSQNPKTKQVTNVDSSLRVPRRKLPPLPTIPDSLPVGRNRAYYNQKPVQVKIELAQPAESEIVFKDNVIITDRPVQTSIELLFSEQTKSSCTKDRVLKEIKVKGEMASEYDIYESLDPLETSLGEKRAYRLIGHGQAFKNQYLQITDCLGILYSDAVILPKGQMQQFATNAVSNLENGLLIGGPDYGNKKLYSLLHYAFIDFGKQDYEVGRTYNTVSKLDEKINSEFVVVSKFGSYAVVVFTSIYSELEVGDRLATADDINPLQGEARVQQNPVSDTVESDLSLE